MRPKQDAAKLQSHEKMAMNADVANEESNNKSAEIHEDASNRSMDERTCIHSCGHHFTSISKIAAGIVTAEIFQNALPVMDIAFVGRLPESKDDLAAAALAAVWFNLGDVAMTGFMSAIDTLLAQSQGAKNRLPFRAWAGTSLVIAALVTVLLAAVLALCGPVMKLVGKDPDLAEKAGVFSYRLMPGLLPHCTCKALVKHLQAQDILVPGAVAGLVANGCAIFFNWLLMHAMGLRIVGAPWATSLTRIVECLLITLHMLCHKSRLLQSTWPVHDKANFSRESLRPFWKLSISGALSETAESVSFQIATILAGLVGTAELNAHSITLTITNFVFKSFPFAAGLAAAI